MTSPRSVKLEAKSCGADAFSTSKGTVVLWTEQTGDRAKLKCIIVDEQGVPRGNGEVLVHDARAWEAVRLDDGIAIALVVANDQDPALGSVVLLRLDAEGKAMGEPIPVSKSSLAQLDVSLVRTSRSLLLAWTDRSNTDSLVNAAAVDLNGRLMVAPRAPLPPQGDQALVALIEPPKEQPNQALLVWEQLPSRPKGPRELHLANLSAEAVASERTTKLSFAPVGRPPRRIRHSERWVRLVDPRSHLQRVRRVSKATCALVPSFKPGSHH